jgi:cobalt-zinc-cadmium efflux system membrane fusion protein
MLVLVAWAGMALTAGCGKQSHPSTGDGHGHGAGAAHTKVEGGVTMCAEHDVPEAACAICKPDFAAELSPGESMHVRLPSPDSASLAGVETAKPALAPLREGIDCVAEVVFDQNRVAQIVAPVGGFVQTVEADLGHEIRERQTVAAIWSASIAETVAKAVLAHQALEREKRLWADRVSSEQALQEAEANHRAACQQARTLGFSEEQIDALGRSPDEPVYLEVRAPFAGEIVERSAVRGALVEAGKPLFTIVDRSVMWAMVRIPEADLGQVHTGQAVELRAAALPGRVFTGTLTWIGPAVDERTRMGRARAEFHDPENLLKDRAFAMVRIQTRMADAALLVPLDAVQHIAGKPYVFVDRGEGLFDVRAVLLGAKAEGMQEIVSGLGPQEPVAVRHAFALKSAMLMSRLGAGCADD